MRTRFLIAALMGIPLGATLLAPKDKAPLWDTPFDQWNADQTKKVLNDSPWVQMQDYGSTMGGQGEQGENEAHSVFYVRLFSSTPIRQSYVRILQLMNNYASMPPDKREAFDKNVKPLLTVDTSKEIVLGVGFHSNVPQTQLDLKRFFETATTATLSQSAYLFGPRGRVDLQKYISPENDVVGARFIFPRQPDGKPLLEAPEKEIRFELWVDPIGQELRVGFQGKKLLYNGQLNY